MEEHRIKSAREIALEKIASIPDLTLEEMQTQKEKEFGPVGEAAARKFLEGRLKVTELAVELGKYRDHDAEIFRKYLLLGLVRALDLHNAAGSRRAMEGLQVLTGTAGSFTGLKEGFEELLGRFEQEKLQRQAICETKAKDDLRRLGISGTAVRINLQDNKDWLAQQDELIQLYAEKVEKLRNGFLKL